MGGAKAATLPAPLPPAETLDTAVLDTAALRRQVTKAVKAAVLRQLEAQGSPAVTNVSSLLGQEAGVRQAVGSMHDRARGGGCSMHSSQTYVIIAQHE